MNTFFALLSVYLMLLHPVFYPVTTQQVMDFLAQDKTDLREYDKASYVCADFAHDLVNNAALAHIKAWEVVIYFHHAIGHVIVAFQTNDNGVIYIEPQSDATYPFIQAGFPACAANFCPGGPEYVRKVVNQAFPGNTGSR